MGTEIKIGVDLEKTNRGVGGGGEDTGTSNTQSLKSLGLPGGGSLEHSPTSNPGVTRSHTTHCCSSCYSPEPVFTREGERASRRQQEEIC